MLNVRVSILLSPARLMLAILFPPRLTVLILVQPERSADSRIHEEALRVLKAGEETLRLFNLEFEFRFSDSRLEKPERLRDSI